MAGFRFRPGRGRSRPGTARRPGRFRRVLSNRILWPSMIGIALAVGFGVQMGESAIGGINPIHFQGAAPPVRAIDPAASPPPATSTYAQAYGWEQGNAARQADSGSNQDFDYVPQPATVQRTADPAWQEPAAPVSLTPWPPGRVSAHPDVERYTDYPIEEKPDARPAPDRATPELPDAPPPAPAGK
jgi:hypothetical protein